MAGNSHSPFPEAGYSIFTLFYQRTMTIKAFAITFDGFNKDDITKPLEVTEYDFSVDSLQPNQVALQVLATPINPSDLLQLSGRYVHPIKTLIGNKETYLTGKDGLFKVIRTGDAVTDFKEGDWVIPLILNTGTWRTHFTVDLSEKGSADPQPIFKVKDGNDSGSSLSIEQATTISVNPPTALQILQQFVTFDKSGKDWIIQNAGNSQVSKYLLQFAKLYNVNVISVIRGGKPNHEEIAADLISFGATKVITEEQSQSEEFQQKIIPGWVNETGGLLKLAVDAVGGALATAFGKVVSEDGYIVSYGQLDANPIQFFSGYQLQKNLTFQSYWISRNTKRDPLTKVKTVNEIVDYYAAGSIQSIPFSKVKYDISSGDGSKLLEAYVQAIKNSSKDKQVVVFE